MFMLPGGFRQIPTVRQQFGIFNPGQILEDPLGAAQDLLDQLIRAGTGDLSSARAEDCRIRPNALLLETARLVALRALSQFSLFSFVTPINWPNIEAQLSMFFVWKLGSINNFCAQYAAGNTAFFTGQFADEAAAFLLGLLDFSAGRRAPQLRLPTRLLIYLRNRNPNMAANCQAVLVNFVGMDPALAATICPSLSQVINNPMPVFATDLPRTVDIGGGLIQRYKEALSVPVVTQQPSIPIVPRATRLPGIQIDPPMR